MTEADLVLAWARAFALTAAVELVVAVPLLARHVPSVARRLALVACAQLLSHPLFWFVLPALHLPRAVFLVTGELWAWLAEASLYVIAVPELRPGRALTVALAANAASFGAWFVLRAAGS
jgi:hypothetical protein